MSQPVKLSDGLVLEARIAGAAMQRSIAGQVEFWAKLGRVMERMLRGGDIKKLCQQNTAQALSSSLETVNELEGRQRLQAYLESKPYPRFVADPDNARGYIREDADGTRTPGRMVGREFIPATQAITAKAL